MRITNQMMANNAIGNIHRVGEQLSKAHETVSTGKKINRPSDDPVGMAQILETRRSLSMIEQYRTDIDMGKTRIEIADQTLDQIQDFLRSALTNANVITPPDYEVAALQVEDFRDQVVQLANTMHNGEYLFAGHRTNIAPFETDGTYNGNNGRIDIAYGQDMRMQINVPGDEVFSVVGGTAEVIEALENLRIGFQMDNQTVIAAQAPILEAAIERITTVRAEGGVRIYRLDAAENQWNNMESALEALLSDTQNADTARAIVELKSLETAYETSLAATGRLFETSLIDYLR